ncbi:unnamed protein product [Penicillium camemberti]|uniref:Str. FM013 n=1 Tax=Penicillium camemberti (strain FM 013) TaxID=1429867 RepID=A0A0G4PG66_PENC3|nr:unnamed protein product [Penicillium camemberti]
MSGQRFDRMFEGLQTFKPVDKYGQSSDKNPTVWRLRYNFNLEFEVDILADLITSEYKLRQTLQQKENLEENIRALEKIPGNCEDKKQLQQYYEELEIIKRDHSKNGQTMFANESMFPPGSLKRNYDAMREDLAWYLRQELVQDCISRGGCCARGCDCCRNRATARYERGVGHCTGGFGCCSSERGFEYTAEEKQQTADQLNSMLLAPNPSYIIKMAEAYFVKPPEKKVEGGGKVKKKKVHWWQ